MDIMVTVPKDQYKHMEDKAWAQYEGNQPYWEMGRVPKKIEMGDKIFFVMDGRVSMYATIISIDSDPHGDHCVLDLRDFRGLVAKPIHKPFRGFRYFDLDHYIREGFDELRS